RNKGYKIKSVIQRPSETSIPLQIIDVFMGIISFLLNNQAINKNELQTNNNLMLKSDLIYRFLINKNNLKRFSELVKLFKWGSSKSEITEVNINDYVGNFIVRKSKFDIQEMNKLQKLLLKFPKQNT